MRIAHLHDTLTLTNRHRYTGRTNNLLDFGFFAVKKCVTRGLNRNRISDAMHCSCKVPFQLFHPHLLYPCLTLFASYITDELWMLKTFIIYL